MGVAAPEMTVIANNKRFTARGERRTRPNARARGIKDTQRNEQQERPRGQERDEEKRRSRTIVLGGSKIKKSVITAASLERCNNLTTSGRATAVLGAPRPAFLEQEGRQCGTYGAAAAEPRSFGPFF